MELFLSRIGVTPEIEVCVVEGLAVVHGVGQPLSHIAHASYNTPTTI